MPQSLILRVTEKSPETFTVPYGRVTLTNVALEAENKQSARVVLCHNGEELTICTLTVGTLNQMRLRLVLPSNEDDVEALFEEREEEDMSEEEAKELEKKAQELQKYEIKVVGKGTVHIFGIAEADKNEPEDEDYDDEEDYDEDEDEEDEDDEDEEDDD